MLNVKDVRDHLQRPLTVTTRSSKSEQAGEDLQSKRPSNVPVLKFVVVGARGSGKSVFINRALDLRKSSQGSSNCKKMSLEGQVFFINLVETQLDDVKITENGKILWPRDTEDEQLSRADGVLALYDVTKQDSISRIPVLLSKFQQPSLAPLLPDNTSWLHSINASVLSRSWCLLPFLYIRCLLAGFDTMRTHCK